MYCWCWKLLLSVWFDIFWFNCFGTLPYVYIHYISLGLMFDTVRSWQWALTFIGWIMHFISKLPHMRLHLFQFYLCICKRRNGLSKDPITKLHLWLVRKTDNLFLSHFLISKELYWPLFSVRLWYKCFPYFQMHLFYECLNRKQAWWHWCCCYLVVGSHAFIMSSCISTFES